MSIEKQTAIEANKSSYSKISKNMEDKLRIALMFANTKLSLQNEKLTPNQIEWIIFSLTIHI
jgi:hypothetical protein